MRANHDDPGTGRVPSFPRRPALGLIICGIALLPMLVGGVAGTPSASAAEASVNLGTATPFAVLAGAGVTNTGPTVLGGDLGTCPTAAITGFPPGVVNGTQHPNDAVACQAQSDLTTAYNSAAGRAPTTTYTGPTDLEGLTLTKGVYKSPESFAVTGRLTLDAQQDPAAVFIFQTGSSLITAVNSEIDLINGAHACNVFWQVGSSATLGVASTFVGTVVALASITGNTTATAEGRLLARNGAVTLDSNKVTAPACATAGSESGSDSASGSDSGSGDSGSGSDSGSGDSGSGDPGSGDPGSGSDSGTGNESSSSTSSTQPSSTTSSDPAGTTPSTRNENAVIGAPSTSGPATDVLGGVVDGTAPNGPAPAGTLPRTGSPIRAAGLLAFVTLGLGAVATRFGRAW